MKKILFCLALAGLGAACKSTADVSASADAAPKAECCAGEGMESKECSDEMKGDCHGEAKTCPVTGKSIE